MSRSACFRVPAIAAALVTLGALALSPASGQQVRGTITDGSAGSPLAGALVALFDADSVVRATTLSDAGGGFILRAPLGDSLRLRVQRIGYAGLESVPILLAPGDSLSLEIHMRPQPVAIEGVTATGESTLRPELERFLRRREKGFGRTFMRDDIVAMGPTSTTLLLARLPGTFLIPAANGTLIAHIPRNYPNEYCHPAVYVDDLLVERGLDENPTSRSDGVPISSYVTPDAILGIEVYRNPAQAPPEYQRPFMEDCPIVLIWTNRSFGIGG